MSTRRCSRPTAAGPAYMSDQSTWPEVYVAPFPGPGQRIQISVSGGTEPVGARNGKELFYREGNKLMAVRLPGGSIDAATVPRALSVNAIRRHDQYGGRNRQLRRRRTAAASSASRSVFL
jgi:hypothetical protein